MNFTKQGKIAIATLGLMFILSLAQNILWYNKYQDALDLLAYSATSIYDTDEYAARRHQLEAKLLSVDHAAPTDSVIGDLLERAIALGYEREDMIEEIYNFVFLNDWEYYCYVTESCEVGAREYSLRKANPTEPVPPSAPPATAKK